MRRVVVGTGPDGRSTVVAEGEPTTVFQKGQRVPGLPGALGPGEAAVAELWSTERGSPTRAESAVGSLPEEWAIGCPPGGTRWRLVAFGPGLAAPMHHTDTLDYSFVVDGEVTLLLGDGREVELRAGDGVVIPGLEHGWRTGARGCTKLLVMTGLAEASPGGDAGDGALARRAAERYIRTINDGRYDDVGSLFAEDAEWYGYGRDPRRGREEIGNAYASYLREITPTIGAASVVASGNQCVVELEVLDRVSGTVRPGPIDHFTVDAAGLITRFAVYDQPRWEPDPPPS